MLRAIAGEGVTPDLIVGSSVGAVNGAWLAGSGMDDLDGLADVWSSLTREDIFPLRPWLGLRAFLGRRDHVVPNDGLRRVVRRNVAFDQLEDARVPFHVVTTELTSGAEVLLSTGPVVEAVLASAAIPAVFPPVEIDGRVLIDGGVTDNAPISQAIALGADEVWVMPTGFPCSIDKPRGALAVGLQALSILVQRQLVVDLVRDHGDVAVWVAPPLCPLDVLPSDFTQTDVLMRRSLEQTQAWLDGGRPPVDAVTLSPHRHAIRAH
jgi:NTE family protein